MSAFKGNNFSIQEEARDVRIKDMDSISYLAEPSTDISIYYLLFSKPTVNDKLYKIADFIWVSRWSQFHVMNKTKPYVL
ncbi:hypothetical protein [Metallosphaera cuprina]|uniref:Uncharacterized protein n=1 Tax=Metallosphaera cuprina (strain Ar-4) TaxID=1006006 RepID=F4G0U6_METCR|nr:hypothetical protein [Metallosphaera cuprina]AEB95905.1 hypothetical protein Mcup_1803 [Metallosphaera cuprina Ar-4]